MCMHSHAAAARTDDAAVRSAEDGGSVRQVPSLTTTSCTQHKPNFHVFCRDRAMVLTLYIVLFPSF